MLLALWLPWFDRRISGGFAPTAVEQTVSGWRALGSLGVVVVLLAVMALVWAGVVRRRPLSALWLVVVGGVSLVVVMAVTVDRVGADGTAFRTTTVPSAGLAVAYAAALAIILVGLLVLVQETRRRPQEG